MSAKSVETSVSEELLAPDAAPEGEHALTIDESQPMSINVATFSSVADFAPDDVWLSKLRLAHGISKEVQNGLAKPGQWLFTGVPPMTSVVIVPIAYTKPVRRYGHVGLTGEKYVACNNHIGAPDAECRNCRTQFEPGLAGKQFNATVDLYYQYMIYMPELRMPAIVEFAKSGMSAAKQMNAYLQTWGFGNVGFRLASEQVKGQYGVYNVPTVTMEQVSDEDLADARALLPDTK